MASVYSCSRKPIAYPPTLLMIVDLSVRSAVPLVTSQVGTGTPRGVARWQDHLLLTGQFSFPQPRCRSKQVAGLLETPGSAASRYTRQARHRCVAAYAAMLSSNGYRLATNQYQSESESRWTSKKRDMNCLQEQSRPSLQLCQYPGSCLRSSAHGLLVAS